MCFNFFSTAQNILKFSNRANGTFGFALHTSQPSAKPKKPFFTKALFKKQEEKSLLLNTFF